LFDVFCIIMSQISHTQLIEKGSYEELEARLDKELGRLPTLRKALDPHPKQNYLYPALQRLKAVVGFIREDEGEITEIVGDYDAYLKFNPKTPGCYSFRVNEKLKKEGIREKDPVGCFIGLAFPDKDNPYSLDRRPEIITFFEHEGGRTLPTYYDAGEWRRALNDFFKME